MHKITGALSGSETLYPRTDNRGLFDDDLAGMVKHRQLVLKVVGETGQDYDHYLVSYTDLEAVKCMLFFKKAVSGIALLSVDSVPSENTQGNSPWLSRLPLQTLTLPTGPLLIKLFDCVQGSEAETVTRERFKDVFFAGLKLGIADTSWQLMYAIILSSFDDSLGSGQEDFAKSHFYVMCFLMLGPASAVGVGFGNWAINKMSGVETDRSYILQLAMAAYTAASVWLMFDDLATMTDLEPLSTMLMFLVGFSLFVGLTKFLNWEGNKDFVWALMAGVSYCVFRPAGAVFDGPFASTAAVFLSATVSTTAAGCGYAAYERSHMRSVVSTLMKQLDDSSFHELDEVESASTTYGSTDKNEPLITGDQEPEVKSQSHASVVKRIENIGDSLFFHRSPPGIVEKLEGVERALHEFSNP